MKSVACWAAGSKLRIRRAGNLPCLRGMRPRVNRVLRGGAFNNNQNNVRAAARNRNNPNNRNRNNGFRVVLSPK